jgi:hypothetical protein
MKTPYRRRVGLCLALGLGLAPLILAAAGTKRAEVKSQYFKGKVVPMAAMLKEFGSRLDADGAPHWKALVTADGKVYPLIRDDGSRMFFNDPKLLNRPMRITGRLFKDTKLLQVLTVHSYHKGKLYEVYYWCDICAIRRGQKQMCECCGGPMELREVPLEK